MNAVYHDSLSIFKTSFQADDERARWVAAISSRIQPSTISLLDVGIGDCESMALRCELLSGLNIQVHLVGIDPILPAHHQSVPSVASCRLIRTAFEDFDSEAAFTVVNATHSLYYMKDVDWCIDRMAGLTSPGGFIVAAVWSQDCILHRLYRECFEAGGGSLHAEKLHEAMCASPYLQNTQLIRTSGEVNLGMWRLSREAMTSAIRILSRLGVDTKVTDAQVRRLDAALQRHERSENRINGIVIAQRRPR